MECLGINFFKLYIRSLERRCRKLGLEPKQIDVGDGTTIHCWVPVEEVHKGKPCLMLVHGFGGTGLTGWGAQVAEFSREYAVYVPDLIFFGKSTSTSSERSESFQAECMLKVLEQHNVTQAYVVGSSYGGFVAFRMAQLRPGLVKKVVIASSGVCMTPTSNDALMKEFGASHIHQVLMPDTVKAQKKSLNLVMDKPRFLPDFIIRQMMEEFKGNREERIQLLDGLVIGTEKARPLPKLSQEVLILWGERDRIFSLDLARELQEHLGPHAKLAVIPNAGHIPQDEQPQEFSNHVLSFLAD